MRFTSNMPVCTKKQNQIHQIRKPSTKQMLPREIKRSRKYKISIVQCLWSRLRCDECSNYNCPIIYSVSYLITKVLLNAKRSGNISMLSLAIQNKLKIGYFETFVTCWISSICRLTIPGEITGETLSNYRDQRIWDQHSAYSLFKFGHRTTKYNSVVFYAFPVTSSFEDKIISFFLEEAEHPSRPT